jgi:hypothetical protein
MAISFIRISVISSPTLSCFGGTSVSEFEKPKVSSSGGVSPQPRVGGRRWFRTILHGIQEDIDLIIKFSPDALHAEIWGMNENFGMTSW